MMKTLLITLLVLLVAITTMTVFFPEPVEREVIREVEVIKEVEVPVEIEVEKEVIREVEVIKNVEVPVEVVREVQVPLETEKEVIKEVEVIKEIEVTKEVEVPVTNTVTVVTTPTPSPGNFFVRGKETDSPEEWKDLVGERRWKTGHSAKSLAYSWEEAGGFPPEVRAIFDNSDFTRLHTLNFVRGYPEHKVPLRGGSSASQSDILVIAESEIERIVISVEGKVKESFGQYVEDWIENASPNSGKPIRLQYLKERLEIEGRDLDDVRYQLLHRTASALIEADRFGVGAAVMLVHSFSKTDEHLADYQAFAKLFGISDANVNTVSYAGNKNGIDLYLAWVKGDKRFLEK